MSRKADYSRICTSCENHRKRRTSQSGGGVHGPVGEMVSVVHECTAAADLVTGDALINRCSLMRSDKGPCGPQGLLFAAKGTIRKAAAE